MCGVVWLRIEIGWRGSRSNHGRGGRIISGYRLWFAGFLAINRRSDHLRIRRRLITELWAFLWRGWLPVVQLPAGRGLVILWRRVDGGAVVPGWGMRLNRPRRGFRKRLRSGFCRELFHNDRRGWRGVRVPAFAARVSRYRRHSRWLHCLVRLARGSLM